MKLNDFLKLNPAEFPSLLAINLGSARLSFESDVITFNNALDEGEISASVFNAIEDNFERLMQQAVGRLDVQYKGQLPHSFVRNLTTSFTLQQVPKKIKLLKDVSEDQFFKNNAYANAMAKFWKEMLPLHYAYIFLQPRKYTVHVRSVRTPNVIRTCPCCLKQHKVQDGVMYRHGFKCKPFTIQNSCDGVRYEPLERSHWGLTYMVGELQKQVNAMQYVRYKDLRKFKELQDKLQTFKTTLDNWTQTEFDYELESWLVGRKYPLPELS